MAYTYESFRRACLSLAEASEDRVDDAVHSRAHLHGWVWRDDPRNGYLTRRSVVEVTEGEAGDTEVIEDEDEAAAPLPNYKQRWRVTHHVVLSRTYQVPQMCLSVHDEATGSSIPLEDIVKHGVIRSTSATDSLAIEPHGEGINLPTRISEDEAPFPLLLQTEHPATGQVVWALHPCETQNMVDEIMRGGVKHRTVEGDLAWLECWLTVCSSMLNLRL